MRRTVLTIFLLFVLSSNILAYNTEKNYLDTTAVISWLDGELLNVALANTSNSRKTVTISTDTLDAWGRPVFDTRNVNIPGRTIVLETLVPSTPRRGQNLNIRVTENYRSITVAVQNWDFMSSLDYIVPTNTELDFKIDLSFMLDFPTGFRLLIDEYYQTDDRNIRGAIRIRELEGGFRQIRQRNGLEFIRPYVVLGLRTPQVTGLTTLAFELRKVESGFNWRDEVVLRPTIFVYGRNMRFVGTANSSNGSTGRIPR